MSVKNVWRVCLVFALITVATTSIRPTQSVFASQNEGGFPKPQIYLITPQAPQLSGVCIKVGVKIDWVEGYGSMHVRFADEGWQESSETQFERFFCTGKYQPGIYKIRVEARKNDDNSWRNPTVTEIDYELTGIPPGITVYFGSTHQTFDARLDSERYRIQGGYVNDYKIQRMLVPNSQTAEAICFNWDLQGNFWDLPDSDILGIESGPDVPDITTDPDRFWEFRNKFFPYCDWIPSQPGVLIQSTPTLQVVPQIESYAENVGPASTGETHEQTSENSWWCKNIGLGCNNDLLASEAPYTTLKRRGPVDDSKAGTQCAEYAALKRPDSLCWLATPADGGLWVKSLSDEEKLALGITVDKHPDVGDIVEFIGCPSGYPSNHVAWVNLASSNGVDFNIYDSNRNYDGVIRQDNFPYKVNESCMNFISMPTHTYTANDNYCYVYKQENEQKVEKNTLDKIVDWWKGLWK